MTNSMLSWHLARDNQRQLAKFCDKYQVDREVSNYYKVDGQNCFNMTTHFDNGAYITAQLIQGVDIKDHYQVIDYKL